MEATIPEYSVGGHIRGRSGSSLPKVAPSNIYRCLDGDFLIAANQDTIFKRLAAAMGRPELAEDPRYATHLARGDRQEELDDLINVWTATRTCEDVAALMEDHAVPSGQIYRAPEMLADPHFAARKAIIEVADDRWGSVKMQNVFPKMSETQGDVRWTGPELGQHNGEVYGELLGLDEENLSELKARGVI